jgi:hypothetical protein
VTRGSGGRQPSAAHGYHFTPLRVSHDPGPGHTRFASRSIQVYILLFPFLALCLITWPFVMTHDLSGRPLGSSLSGPDVCLVNGELSLTFGLQISQWKCACFFFLAITIHSSGGSDRYSLSPIRALQVQPKRSLTFTSLVHHSSERSRKLQSVSPLKLPRIFGVAFGSESISGPCVDRFDTIFVVRIFGSP